MIYFQKDNEHRRFNELFCVDFQGIEVDDLVTFSN